jgi:hypothetical protein
MTILACGAASRAPPSRLSDAAPLATGRVERRDGGWCTEGVRAPGGGGVSRAVSGERGIGLRAARGDGRRIADLLAEEVASRCGVLKGYEWNQDEARASHRLREALEIHVRPRKGSNPGRQRELAQLSLGRIEARTATFQAARRSYRCVIT